MQDQFIKLGFDTMLSLHDLEANAKEPNNNSNLSYFQNISLIFLLLKYVWGRRQVSSLP